MSRISINRPSFHIRSREEGDWFRGTKALKALVGLQILGIVFTKGENLNLSGHANFSDVWKHLFHIFSRQYLITLQSGGQILGISLYETKTPSGSAS